MLSREQEEPEVAPVETLISSRLVVTGRAPGEEELLLIEMFSCLKKEADCSLLLVC